MNRRRFLACLSAAMATVAGVTRLAEAGLRLPERKAIEDSMEGDFDTDNLRYKVRERFTYADPLEQLIEDVASEAKRRGEKLSIFPTKVIYRPEQVDLRQVAKLLLQEQRV